MHYFYLILASIFCLHALPARAQKQDQLRIDSLLARLPELADDTNKVNLLVDLSFTYSYINPELGIRRGNEALELARRLRWKKGMAYAFNRLGVNYDVQGDYARALEHYFTAKKLSEELGDKKALSKALGNIGVVYREQADYPRALEHYLAALKLCEEIGDASGVAIHLGNVGNVYMDQHKLAEALDYNSRALKAFEAMGDKKGVARNLGNLGIVYKEMKDYTRALQYEMKAAQLYEELGNRNGVAINYGNIGLTCHELGNFAAALEYYAKALDIKRELGDKKGIAINLGNIAATYLEIANADPAKAPYLQLGRTATDTAILLSRQIGDLLTLSKSYLILSQIQARQGEHQNALANFKLAVTLRDSIFNRENDKKLTRAALQYEFDKKEAAIKAAQEKRDLRQRIIRNVMLTGLAVALLFLIVVNSQRNRLAREKKRSEDLLLNILPAEVAQELKQNGTAAARDFSEVTVMFTDFKDFTRIGEQLNAQQLVNEINYCYSAFDEIIGKYHIEKIKTIGDSYMCASGLPVSSATHAEDMVRAAIEIRDFMLAEKQKRAQAGQQFFEIRIGCHSGPVVAGIVGLTKIAYDIWGDTVNVAARMESSGEAGKINISGATHERIKEKFDCVYRGKVEAKNKGMVDMYFVADELASFAAI